MLQAVNGTEGITAATLPDGPVANKAGYSDIIAIPNVVTANNETLAPVRAVQATVKPFSGVVGVAGDGPTQQDYIHAVYGNFPMMFTIIALLTLILLMRAFRSLPARAQGGAAQRHLDGSDVRLPDLVLAERPRLERDLRRAGNGSDHVLDPADGLRVPVRPVDGLRGLHPQPDPRGVRRPAAEVEAGTNDAVVRGLGRTGRLVTSAALILFLAFSALASGPQTDIKVLGTGLGVGILLDATIVRALLVPALMSLMGKWNWWLPAPLARVLRVEPSPI